ncbi:ABC-three component system middle component 1 [Thalassospira sp.]|uniref:ABC-three component system middle component 1 n=1 Tax=Thalassospira sp. TaxID=1912094 RepID=UPI0032EAE1D3
MSLEKFCNELICTSRDLEWEAKLMPGYASKQFKGREGTADVALPEKVVGLQLGDYPVLAGEIDLHDTDQVRQAIKQFHNQVVIARSYMEASQVINTHLILRSTVVDEATDWHVLINLIERDEAVCRKLVWKAGDKEEFSCAELISRTFLARPWRKNDMVNNAPLDHNQNLVERVLIGKGLPAKTAKQWIEYARKFNDEPLIMIPKLVEAWRKGK